MKFIDNVINFRNTEKYCTKLNLNNKKSLFLSILMIFMILPVSSNAQSWLDYNYRRALTITNSSGSTLTDYQVQVTLTSSNFNNNFPQPDGDDIRITASDGTTLLPYWIESWSSNQGTIWTKIPSIPVGTSTISLYYGNNVAVSLSNGSNTFNLFEDNWIINPVQISSQPSWESGISYPMVFKEGSVYHMIYDGSGYGNNGIGLSASTDLINWTPYASNPIIGYDTSSVFHGPPGSEGQYAWGDMIKVVSTYHMYPSKGPGITVHAQSTDLINWTDFTPVATDDPFGPGAIGTGAAILKEADGITPFIIDGKYWMVYCHGSTPGPVYLASSTNLTTWNIANNGNPILTGSAGQWDEQIYNPSFIRVAGKYYIYYQGAALASSVWSIGFASAPDTDRPDNVTWTKNSGNPVHSANHGWDSPKITGPKFRYFDGTYYLFYTGGNANNGFATSTSPEGPWSQTNTFFKNLSNGGGLSPVSGGIVNIASAQNIQTQLSYSTGNALGFRAFYRSDISGYKWAGFVNGDSGPTLTIQIDPGESFLKLKSFDGSVQTTKSLGTSFLDTFHNFEITWLNSAAQCYIDHSFVTDITANIPGGPLPINFQNLNNLVSNLDVDWVYLRKFSSPDPAVTTIGTEESKPLYVVLKVFLEGPYNGAGAMTTNLNSIIPLSSNDAYSTATYGYTASVVGSIPNATIVDWVLVELRTGTASGTKVGTRAAFLKSDGTIVDIDGTSPVRFSALVDGNYYVVVRHRNHLAIMTASTISLNSVSATLYDFSTLQSQAFGTNPLKALSGGGFGMIAADASRDGTINATDLNTYWIPQNGTVYDYQTKTADFNLDATINATDLNVFWIPGNGKATQVP